MKTIRRYRNVAAAGFAQSLLEAIGIDAALADERAFTLGPQYVPWGIRLQVPEPDVERAEGVLDRQEGFLPIDDDFVPPPLPPEEAIPSPPSGISIAGAFIRGGFWAVVVFALFALIARAAGGNAHADFGGLVLIFVFGGIIGIRVRASVINGRRDGTNRPE